ncbi:hypothetical protein SAMN02745136_03556 [Anaerocolumna jejuensis DSM 15929]|uniref:Nucleotidyl transferase AbiEii toxin, Type IV TA system n=1 Tax=Anaerocolumna jejuensis DSM 15929 TaxID=1121322 RepID=A0A1M6W2I9_9FIRM|nr:hypothetical protein [Anaerocolumna jejuensis]SHK87941.1 hypothetical protein SAMN02745136_03556 [Anaerocolumna jejuensis DSM 15929]
MILGNKSVIDNALDISSIGITFSSKPIIVGGLAMEYYGLRKCGDDIDLIISNEDYQILASQYSDYKIDIWGDLGIKFNQFELLRSISRLDYDFYSKGAVEYEKYKVLSFDRLFFMTAAAVRSEPDVQKRVDDFGLALGHCYNNYRNQAYVTNAELNITAYENAPDGTIFGGKYA